MKQEQDYIRDIAEIRSMMERSSKFLSLSGWAGVMAGIYAVAGAYIASRSFDFESLGIISFPSVSARFSESDMWNLAFVAVGILLLAVGTAAWLSAQRAKKRSEKLWTPVSRQLIGDMFIPLVTGGLLLLIFLRYGMIYFFVPCSLIFYGLALYNAGRFTYTAVKTLGYVQIALGLLSIIFVPYELICWVLGFGVMHIIYGIYIHYKYER